MHLESVGCFQLLMPYMCLYRTWLITVTLRIGQDLRWTEILGRLLERQLMSNDQTSANDDTAAVFMLRT